eukprot:8187534-Pyramimonas_sp.AAC.1
MFRFPGFAVAGRVSKFAIRRTVNRGQPLEAPRASPDSLAGRIRGPRAILGEFKCIGSRHVYLTYQVATYQEPLGGG